MKNLAHTHYSRGRDNECYNFFLAQWAGSGYMCSEERKLETQLRSLRRGDLLTVVAFSATRWHWRSQGFGQFSLDGGEKGAQRFRSNIPGVESRHIHLWLFHNTPDLGSECCSSPTAPPKRTSCVGGGILYLCGSRWRLLISHCH